MHYLKTWIIINFVLEDFTRIGERHQNKRGCTTNTTKAESEYEITEEKGTWNGFTVWYVKPKATQDNFDAIPHFVLSDGESFRYALTPEESFEILKCFEEE